MDCHGPLLDERIPQFIFIPQNEHRVVSVPKLGQVSLVLTDRLVELSQLLLEALAHGGGESVEHYGECCKSLDTKELAQLHLGELGQHIEVDSRLTTCGHQLTA